MNGKLWIPLALLVVPAAASAQFSYTGGFYSQNFDSLAASGTNIAWTDGAAPLAHWHMRRGNDVNQVLADQYNADTGGSNAGAVYSYGAGGSSERALGAIGSNSVEYAIFGLHMVNSASTSFTSVTVTYTGEQWRNGGNTSTNTLAFSYDVAAPGGSIGNDGQTSTTAPNFVADPNFTAVSSLNFVSPTVGSTAAALDGNNVLNQAFITATFTLNETWDPGEDLWIRWVKLNELGNDHGLAIDALEVSATPVPEPATMAVLGIGALAAIRRRNRR